jgi:hypothetical protein
MHGTTGVRKVLAEQISEMVSAVQAVGVAKVAHKWRRKMTTAVYAVSWGAVTTEFYIAEATGDTARASAIESFLDTVVAQEMAELPGHTREAVVAYLRRGVVLSRLMAANIRQVFTDLTLHGLGPDEQRGMWAGMPFIRPASMGRARMCLELLVAQGVESPEVLQQAEADYMLLTSKLEAFTGYCREVRPDYSGLEDDEVCNEFDPDYLRCVQAGSRAG